MSTLPKKPLLIAIVGPTSSGKSDLAVKVAKRWNGEVVSADSRQVYKGLTIGSGKITKKEARGVPHHLLDVASPKQIFTVTRYQKLANKSITQILERGRLPILCGGTGLYIDAVLYHAAFPAVPPNPALRKQMEKRSTEYLFVKLQALDPVRAKTIDRYNKRRLIRALEIRRATKKPIMPLRQTSRYNILVLGVHIPYATLKKRIHIRLMKRLRQGLTGEVANLHRKGLSWKRLDNFGLEYRFVSRYLREIREHPSTRARHARARAEMIAAIEKESYRYAKRQVTWFKRNKEIQWIDRPEEALVLVGQFLRNK